MKIIPAILLVCICTIIAVHGQAPEIRNMPNLSKLHGVSSYRPPAAAGRLVTKETLESWKLPVSVDIINSSVSNGVVIQAYVTITVQQVGPLDSFSHARLYVGATPLIPFSEGSLAVDISIHGKALMQKLTGFHISPFLAQQAYVQLFCNKDLYVIALKSWFSSSSHTAAISTTFREEQNINETITAPANKTGRH